MVKLLGFNYMIQYKSGAQNVVADSLFRVPPPSTMLLLSIPHSLFMDQLRKSCATNTAYQEMLHKILHHPIDHLGFIVKNGMIFSQDKTWLPASHDLSRVLMDEYHLTPTGGHMGVAKTFCRINQHFCWPQMRHDIKQYIRQCATFQTTKHSTLKPAGLLQPIPPPSSLWVDLSMDFVTGLPISQGYTTILVVVDRYSKAIHLGPLPQHYTAHKVVVLFLDIVCKHHDFPDNIISDRDPIFLSAFWRNLFCLSRTKLRFSTAYHPQSDGQTEVINRVLEQYLRAYVHDNPRQWSHFLSLVEYSYNTSVHSGTSLSPFEVMFGKPPPALPLYGAGTSPIEAVNTILSSRETIHSTLTRRLQKYQANMKRIADAHCRDLCFNVGDWVYIHLRPYRQTSLQPTYSKLSKHFYGPYPIVERIGQVAYRLQLPSSSKINPVFHISLLKLHQGPHPTAVPDMSAFTIDHHPLVHPLRILDWKMDESTTPPTLMTLVQWAGLPPEETTWENWSKLQKVYNLEDKVYLQTGGIDSTTQTQLPPASRIF